MKNYLPSKKLSFFILIVLIIFCFFLFGKKLLLPFTSPEKKIEKIKKELSETKVVDLITSDVDNDGVYDWEETLWRTDLNNKKTFDNVPDRDWINMRKKELDIEEKSTIETGEKMTETDKISRELFSTFLALNQKGLINETSIEELGNVFSKDILLGKSEIEVAEDDISFKIINDTPQNKENYRQNILKILEKYQERGLGKELVALSVIVEDPETNFDLKSLSLSAKAYQEVAEEFLNIEVPDTVSENHKKIIAEAIKTAFSLEMIKTYYENDPVLSTRGLYFYRRYSDSFEMKLYTLLSYFQ